MNVTREVVLDLLPLYLAGEASPATRAVVEDYLKQDPELAKRIRLQWAESLEKAVPSDLPPDLELRSLRRTRSLLGWQSWLLGFAIGLTVLGSGISVSFEGLRFRQLRFLLFDYPNELGFVLALGIACWVAYFLVRRRLRTR